jgi:signal transduction histidine kinase
MWPTDNLPRGQVGPAMTTLRAVVARLAAVVRGAGVAFLIVQVVSWHAFYAADPWRLAGPVAATAWALAVLAYLRRRWPGPVVACLDSAVYLALAVSAQVCVPPALRGHAFSWLVIIMLSQLIVLAWYAPAALCVPLAVAAPVAHWLGARGSGPTSLTVILLITIAGAHIYGRRTLYRRAAAADAALFAADQEASEQYAILSRNLERREHERLLHDTILNTLTALARAGADDPVARCRQDVALIESALAAPEAPPGLTDGINAVTAAMRARGLDVQVTGAGPPVPAPVAAAVVSAVREALSNVAAHAGTSRAWVEVCGTGPSGLRVMVRDKGTGFDPATVDPTRLGLRRSIAERLSDCGGHAAIQSAPGRGTVVQLSWPGG